MNSKSILIAVAAFALTATSAQAYVGSQVLARAGLSEVQIGALEEARMLRSEGEIKKARNVLVKAGIDEETLVAVREAARAAREATRLAIENNDFAAFKTAIEGTPLSDIITTQADFELFREAHALKRSGAHTEAREIFANLGVLEHGAHHSMRHRGVLEGRGAALSDEQRDALRAARQANDRETVRAILDEAGEYDGFGRGR